MDSRDETRQIVSRTVKLHRMSKFPADKSQGSSILAVSFGTLIPAVVVVAARVYARISSSSFGLDDSCIIVSTLLSIFGAVCNLFEVNSGFGKQ